MFLTDDISIAYRHTTIRGPWPLYAWWIDCLTPSTCRCKRHVVLVTHLSLSTHSPVRVRAEGWGRDMWGYTDTNSQTPNPSPKHSQLLALAHQHTHGHQHACTKSPHLTCSFPAPKDRSGTAVTREVTRLQGVRLSRLWESPTQGHRSLPAALSVWKVMGHSLTTMRRRDRVSKGDWGQWEAQIYRYWAEPRPSARGNYTEYEHARWGLAAIFHFHPEPL